MERVDVIQVELQVQLLRSSTQDDFQYVYLPDGMLQQPEDALTLHFYVAEMFRYLPDDVD